MIGFGGKTGGDECFDETLRAIISSGVVIEQDGEFGLDGGGAVDFDKASDLVVPAVRAAGSNGGEFIVGNVLDAERVEFAFSYESHGVRANIFNAIEREHFAVVLFRVFSFVGNARAVIIDEPLEIVIGGVGENYARFVFGVFRGETGSYLLQKLQR